MTQSRLIVVLLPTEWIDLVQGCGTLTGPFDSGLRLDLSALLLHCPFGLDDLQIVVRDLAHLRSRDCREPSLFVQVFEWNSNYRFPMCYNSHSALGDKHCRLDRRKHCPPASPSLRCHLRPYV